MTTILPVTLTMYPAIIGPIAMPVNKQPWKYPNATFRREGGVQSAAYAFAMAIETINDPVKPSTANPTRIRFTGNVSGYNAAKIVMISPAIVPVLVIIRIIFLP